MSEWDREPSVESLPDNSLKSPDVGWLLWHDDCDVSDTLCDRVLKDLPAYSRFLATLPSRRPLAMANAQLSLADRVALLSLMSLMHEVSNADLYAAYGVTIDRESRSRLEKHGYVTCRRDSGQPGRPYVHELTEQGWRRGREELHEAPPEKAGKPYRILYAYLNHADRLMIRLGLTLEDFLTARGDAPQPQDIEQRVRSAYADLAKEPGSPVLLRLLRQHLADISREDVDAALMRLVLMPGVHLEPESKQRMLSDADWNAAIAVGGEARHLLTIGRP